MRSLLLLLWRAFCRREKKKGTKGKAVGRERSRGNGFFCNSLFIKCMRLLHSSHQQLQSFNITVALLGHALPSSANSLYTCRFLLY